MTKKILTLSICLLLFAFVSYAKDNTQQSKDAKQEAQAQEEQLLQEIRNANDFNYASNGNTDSATNEAKTEKATFRDRLINSSHFSSKTATETYMPLNKLE